MQRLCAEVDARNKLIMFIPRKLKFFIEFWRTPSESQRTHQNSSFFSCARRAWLYEWLGLKICRYYAELSQFCETQWPWPPLFSPSWLIQWSKGEGVLYNLVFTEWGHCVSQNKVWGCYIGLTLFSPSDVTACHRINFATSFLIHCLFYFSALCSLAGTIFTVSSEVSVLTLALITLERIVVIVTPGRMTRWNSRCGYALCALAWLLGIALGIVPILPIPYFGRGFYSRSSLCVPLHITRELAPGWQYAVSVFMGLNSASLLIVVFGYLVCNHVVFSATHREHDVVVTLNQRHWHWFNVAPTPCAQWVLCVM